MAQQYNIELDQGSASNFAITLKDQAGKLDLTGFTAAMQIRSTPFSSEAVDTLTTDNGRLQIDVEQSKILVSFPCFVTETYPAQKMVYDIEIESEGGEITRILEGSIKVCREVTRVRCER